MKKFELSYHSLKRAKQIGFTEDNILDMLAFAKRISGRGHERIYEHGGTKFYASVKKDKIVIKTIWDDNIPRNANV